MTVIFGGAYQGKLSYALERFGLSDDDICNCTDSDTAQPCGKIIYELDKWLLALVRAGLDTGGAVTRLALENPDAVIICNDISCGVVPEDPELRAWREAVGRALAALSRDAAEVIRLFCGIATRIK